MCGSHPPHLLQGVGLRQHPIHARFWRGVHPPPTEKSLPFDDLPDDVQIIVIGDSSAMASWVAAKGVDEVAVIDSAPV